MSPLTSIDGLSEAAAWAEEVASTLSSGRTVVLDGAADANVMLGLVQLEAALLDRGLPYRRALSPSTHVLPASERASPVVGDSNCIVRSSKRQMHTRHSRTSMVPSTVLCPLRPRSNSDVINGHAPERSARPSSARWWLSIWHRRVPACVASDLGCCWHNGVVAPWMPRMTRGTRCFETTSARKEAYAWQASRTWKRSQARFLRGFLMPCSSGSVGRGRRWTIPPVHAGSQKPCCLH